MTQFEADAHGGETATGIALFRPRRQGQKGKRDIETLYLQAVNNATRFIYIENQYFRWPPLSR